MIEQLLEERVGLAFHDDRRKHQGHHTSGRTQSKTLTHRKSSKIKSNTIPNWRPITASPAAQLVTKKRSGRSGGVPRPTFLDLFKKASAGKIAANFDSGWETELGVGREKSTD
jgi:hypothetical protein